MKTDFQNVPTKSTKSQEALFVIFVTSVAMLAVFVS